MAMNLSNIAAAKNRKKKVDKPHKNNEQVLQNLYPARGLLLSEKLFRTLDIKMLIDIFFAEVNKELDCDSIGYSNKKLDISLSLGKASRHCMEYNIVLSGQSLGEVMLTRARLFLDKEIALMENLICALVYPLRNASMYQLAMMSAFQDPLTGINNRSSLEKALPREISLAQRHSSPLVLLVIDVDNFKEINDTHGHPVGDIVLRRLTEAFEDSLRNTDLVFRYGGDEFVVMLNNTSIVGGRDVAERIREEVERCTIEIGNVTLVLSVSIGMTELTQTDTLESVFFRADEALLLAKREGRNRVIQV